MTIAALRRTFACLAVLGVAVLAPAAAASAAPSITSFKITPVAIPGFPGIGNLLGAGAVIRGHLAIAGAEHGGSPPPLTGLKSYAPVGAKLHPQGFATCAPSVIEKSGPDHARRSLRPGAKGFAVGVVSFGGERVKETASVQPFFAPGCPGAVRTRRSPLQPHCLRRREAAVERLLSRETLV
jgi:hypothetical protein